MTNKEKFKEVFGLEIDDTSDCGYFDCTDRECKDCSVKDTKDWWNTEYKEPTTKNDLGVDCVSRAEVLRLMKDNWHTHNGDWAMQESMDDIRALPSVTPQEPQTFKWCTNCKEYDQEKHCCHRWSKVIRDTVEEMRQEPILDKIFCIAHPLSIMSTPELEHKAIMQIAEMLEPLCLPEGGADHG